MPAPVEAAGSAVTVDEILNAISAGACRNPSSILDELRGRVFSIVSLKAGLSPVEAFIAGIGADLVGPRTMTLIFSSIVVAIAVTVFLAVPIVREHCTSHATTDFETL